MAAAAHCFRHAWPRPRYLYRHADFGQESGYKVTGLSHNALILRLYGRAMPRQPAMMGFYYYRLFLPQDLSDDHDASH